VTDTIQVK